MARNHARHRFLMSNFTARALGSAVALLFPRVRVIVIAARLPEPGYVVLDELHAGDPLRALPEVEVGHEPTYRRAVIERERLAVDAVGDQRVLGGRFAQRHVSGEAVRGFEDHEPRFAL